MMNKEKANLFLDFYENLLTDKQKTICYYYYREDFSLSEISEILDITRSAVFDALKKSNKILEKFETKLKCVSSFNKRMAYYLEIKKFDVKEINQLIDACIETE
ncbi:MAG: YlxM family DNA-binding protein [Anaerorhabdus sp.]